MASAFQAALAVGMKDGKLQLREFFAGTSRSPERHHIRLACRACQRKKIKCDRVSGSYVVHHMRHRWANKTKNFPCGKCLRSSLQCVPSSGKPRARRAGKRAIDSELRSRITKLESLFESLSGEVGIENGVPAGESNARSDAKESSSPAVGKYIGSQFWSSLTTEGSALRDALEDEQAEDEPTSPSTLSGPGNAKEYDLILCPPGSIYVMPGPLPEPTPELSATLCNIFCNNVDRTFKLYHTPTLRAFMIGGQPYLGHDPSAPCNKAVKAAVWFAAINTLTESQCQMTFGQSRWAQLQHFRKIVHVSMAQADLMNTTELSTFQALATYIVSIAPLRTRGPIADSCS